MDDLPSSLPPFLQEALKLAADMPEMHQDRAIFKRLHEDGAKEWGYLWYEANRKIVRAARAGGVDPTDEHERTLLSLYVYAVLRTAQRTGMPKRTPHTERREGE